MTFHPVMGRYLSHIGNQKADPTIPRYPDENYAREVMQLFSIGLWELNPDGSRIQVDNASVPTYSNREITEFARVFTGLWFPRRFWGSGGYTDPDHSFPMEMHPDYHDFNEKVLFLDRGLPGRPRITIPARSASAINGILDIDNAIDALFEHPNTPPFICRALFQFLVTANPSGAYVQRVQDRFVNNGSGIRGDLGAVVRAILLDPEARNTQGALQVSGFGMLKEPALRTTAIWSLDIRPRLQRRNRPGRPTRRLGLPHELALLPRGHVCRHPYPDHPGHRGHPRRPTGHAGDPGRLPCLVFPGRSRTAMIPNDAQPRHIRADMTRRQFLGESGCAAVGTISVLSTLLSLKMANRLAAADLPPAGLESTTPHQCVPVGIREQVVYSFTYLLLSRRRCRRFEDLASRAEGGCRSPFSFFRLRFITWRIHQGIQALKRIRNGRQLFIIAGA